MKKEKKSIYNYLIPLLAFFCAFGVVKALTVEGTSQEIKDLMEQESICQEQNLGYGQLMQSKTVLDAISATTTSSAIDIEGAKRVVLYFDVSNVTGSGLATSTFVVTVSADGTNFVTYNKLIDNIVNTNAQGLTRVASEIVATNATSILTMDLTNDIFKSFKVTDTIIGTTTSIVTVSALIDY